MKYKIFLVSLIFTFFLTPSFFSKTYARWVLDESGFLYYETGQILGKTARITPPGKKAETPAAKKLNTTTPVVSLTPDASTITPASVSPTPSVRIPPGIQKILLEGKNDKLELKFMNSAGQQVEEPPVGTQSSQFDIEDPDDENTTTLRATQNAALVIRNKVMAKTNFPLMVNLETNELIVTTPKGSKVVTVLPDAAVQHMLAANVLDQLGGKGGLLWLEYQKSLITPTPEPTITPEIAGTITPEISGTITPEASGTPTFAVSGTPTPEPSGTVTPEPSITGEPEATPTLEEPTPTIETALPADTGVTLTLDEEGNLVYEIEGTKNKKFLGFYPVELKRKAIVSAETGELLSIQQDFPTRILDLMSF